jgi:hypothetical protein
MSPGSKNMELEERDRVVHTTRPEQPVPKQVQLFFLGRSDALATERGTA